MMTLDEMKKRKQQTGLTCEQIAERSGVPLGTVQKVFSGVTKNPRFQTLRSLEKAFPTVSAGIFTHPVHVVADSAAAYDAGYDSYGDDFDADQAGRNPGKVKYDRQGTYTLKDYLALPDDQRVELIDGVFYDMSAPYTVHQAICVMLTSTFYNFIEENGGPCEVWPSPVDVQLDEDDRTIVEPDICIVCKPEKVHKERIFGAPDFVVEILSRSTKKKDLTLKMWKYSNAGVREYWAVDPDKLTVTVFDFEHDNAIQTYSFHDKVPVGIYDGKLVIDFEKILKRIQGRYGM